MRFKLLLCAVICVLLGITNSVFGDGLITRRAEIGFSSTPYLDDELNLHVSLDFMNRSRYPIQDIRVYYREFSETRFRSESLKPEGFRYLASVNLSRLEGSLVEYFIDVEYADGSREQYPEEAPETNLFKVSLNQEFESDGNLVIISPEAGETIYTDEFLLTVSFFQYSNNVDKDRTRLYLDTWDVSRYVQVFDDFLTFAPKRVPPGRHQLRLELYGRSGRLLVKEEWNFTAIQRKGPSPVESEFQVSGNYYAEARTEELVDGLQSNQYNKSGLRLNADYKNLSFGTRLFVSNQEKSRLQPINRYTGWFQLNFWNNRYLRVTGGDAYPRLNPFLMDNVFLRGVYGQLFLKFLNFDFATGKTRRDIEGNLFVTPTTSGPDTTISPGTFERDLWAARTSFGARDNFQWGFSVVKGKDNVNSIKYGKEPEESAAVGTDIYIASNNNRIVLEGSFNLSAYNPNILDGKNEPLDTLENLGVDIDPDLYDLATDIITVNQYLIVYPAQAYQAQMRLNYFNNRFSVSYKYVQDEFHSLGQPFLLRDNKGFAITDNVRLFQNQLFLNLRYQEYENNLADTKAATTTNRTIGFNVSYFPLRNLPSLTFGYNNYQRNNGITSASNALTFPEDNVTNTINFSTSYGFLFSDLRNRLTLNVLNYNRTDETAAGIDNLSNTVSFILQTQYNFPLKTNVEFSFQQTENTAAQANTSELTLNSFGAGAEYKFDKLLAQQDNLRLAVNGRMGVVGSQVTMFAVNSTSQFDYNRSFLNGRLIYTNYPYGRISLNADLVNYTGDRQFQDYIITARYDVSF